MTTPRQRIEADVKAALKAREQEKLATLRLLLTAINNERIRLGQEVDESTFLQLVQKAIKMRREAADQYRQGKREELAAREEREAQVLAAYLPPPASEEEIGAAIQELLDEAGLSGSQALGAVMKAMMARFRGRADGATINRLARRLLDEKE